MIELAVIQHPDVASFSELVESFLLEHEAAHCLQLGLLGAMAERLWPDQRLFTVESNGQPVLVAMQTPPHPLILSRTDRPDAVSVFVRT